MSPQFLTVPWFLHWITRFLHQYSWSCVFCFPIISHIWASRGWLWPSYACIMRVAQSVKGGKYEVGQDTKEFFWVLPKLFWRVIYCANLRPKPDYQSGSLSHRVLGRQDPWIISEYNLTTTISIRPLIQTCMREMGSSTFSAMSRLKFVCATRAPFTRTP